MLDRRQPKLLNAAVFIISGRRLFCSETGGKSPYNYLNRLKKKSKFG